MFHIAFHFQRGRELAFEWNGCLLNTCDKTINSLMKSPKTIDSLMKSPILFYIFHTSDMCFVLLSNKLCSSSFF